jgi:hypothetical protein
MKASDVRTFFGGRFFLWYPSGYLVLGFFYKGHNYAIVSLKVRDGWASKAKFERKGKCRYLNVKREEVVG